MEFYLAAVAWTLVEFGWLVDPRDLAVEKRALSSGVWSLVSVDAATNCPACQTDQLRCPAYHANLAQDD